MRSLLCLLVVASVAGCHARFKKHVDSIDHVRPDLPSVGRPTVNLGMMNDDSLLGAAVNLGQAVKSEGLTQRINRAVRPHDVGDAFVDSLATRMRKRPFEVRDKSRHTLQLEMLHYGIDVPGIGHPGALTYVVRTQITKGNGKKIYRATHTCALSFAEFQPVSVAIGAVNNAAALRDMSRPELRALFEDGARTCAQQVVARIRKHAG